MRLPPLAPPGPEATLMPDPGPGEVPTAATAPPPALPETVESPFWQAPIPAMETSGQRPQDSISAGSPSLYPPLSVSTDRKEEENTGIRGCTPPRNRGKEPTTDTPQRATTTSGLGHYHQLPVAYYYQPFSSMDILNWQRHTPPYSGESQAMIRLIETA